MDHYVTCDLSTHRQRTQRYIRELENEVLNLRNLSKSMDEKNRTFHSQVQILMATLVANHIPLPVLPHVAPDPATPELDFSATSDSSDSAASPMVSIDVSGLSTTAPEKACSIIASERVPVELDLETMKHDHHPGCPGLPSIDPHDAHSFPQVTNGIVPARLDSQTGVDFVLHLERTCFPHVKYALENDLDILPPNVMIHNGPGHVFTATASLLRAAETPNPTAEPFNLHENEIDRLLDASRRLNLESEVTPVQIWERIKAMAQTRMITPMQLQCLTEDFSKYTFCNR